MHARCCEPVVFVRLDGRFKANDAIPLCIGCSQLNKTALRELDALEDAQGEVLASQVPLQVPGEVVTCNMTR